MVCGIGVWESRTPHKLLWRVRLVGHAGPAIHRTGSVRRSWLVMRSVRLHTVRISHCMPSSAQLPSAARPCIHARLTHSPPQPVPPPHTTARLELAPPSRDTTDTHQPATFHSQVARMPRPCSKARADSSAQRLACAGMWIGPTSAPGLARAGTPTSAAHGQRRARRRGCRRSRMRARRQTCAAGSGRCTCRTVRRQKQEKCRRKTRLQRAIWVFRTVACRSCELA
jgi:hypothetical protein